jgi:hypothetical protein
VAKDQLRSFTGLEFMPVMSARRRFSVTNSKYWKIRRAADSMTP